MLRYRLKFNVCALLILFLATANNNALATIITYNGTSTAESNWQTAAGSTVLEDFESYSAGTQISSLPALGISFDILAGGGYPQAYFFGGTPHGPMQLGNFPNGINTINQYDDIVLRVLPGFTLSAFGFWNGDGQNDTFVANAYDASNNLIGSVGALKGTFAGLTSTVSISRVVFDGNTGDGWNHLDGLQTNATVTVGVPEPGTLGLVLMSIIGSVASMRKHRLST